MEGYAYVYILANGFKKIYIGVTSELEIRIRQHKQKKDPTCHTARYNINKLVYFERFATITAAIAREKQLKGWLRIRKLDSSSRPIQRGLISAQIGESRFNPTPGRKELR